MSKVLPAAGVNVPHPVGDVAPTSCHAHHMLCTTCQHAGQTLPPLGLLSCKTHTKMRIWFSPCATQCDTHTHTSHTTHACSNTRKTSDIQEVESCSMQRASNACLHLASKSCPRCVSESCVGDMGYVHRLHAIWHACHCRWMLLEGASGMAS